MIDFTGSFPSWNIQVRVRCTKNKKKLKLADKEVLRQLGAPKSYIKKGFTCAARSYNILINKQGYAVANIIFDKNQLGINMVAHEAMHATFRILERANVVFCDESEEAFAYLHGAIVEMICKELKLIKK